MTNDNYSLSVIKSLKKGLTVRETSKFIGVSTRTVMKVKKWETNMVFWEIRKLQ